jgi:magnesium transporter
MRTDFIRLRADQSAGQALEWLRTQPIGERVIYFYAVDGDDKLRGVVPTRRLLMTSPEVLISSIMVKSVITLPASASLAEACELFVMHRKLAYPVIDDEGRILGIVDVAVFNEEIFELSERQAAEDVFQLIGLRLSRRAKESVWSRYKVRFPWLVASISGGMLCAFIISANEDFLDSHLVIALFIPVVLALTESVSMQAMTLTLQRLHGAPANWTELGVSTSRELIPSMLLGVSCAALVGLVAYAWRGSLAVAGSIAGTIMLAIVASSMLGVMLPMLMKLLRGDPRIAAGPMVLAIADLLTLVLLFRLARSLLE